MLDFLSKDFEKTSENAEVTASRSMKSKRIADVACSEIKKI